MKLSEWIVEYADDNNIELPEDIPDDETAIIFLKLAKESE